MVYFLETASRVAGANLAEMVEAASGINLWGEWAKIETAVINSTDYKLPNPKKGYAGIITSLSRFKEPDYSDFNDQEVVWKNNKEYHVGLVVCSNSREKVLELLDKYSNIIHEKFHAVMPND